jgi:hypothetical protein
MLYQEPTFSTDIVMDSTEPANFTGFDICVYGGVLIINGGTYFFPIVCLIYVAYLKQAFLQFLLPFQVRVSLDETSIVYQT